jgi:hypothetical protein
MLGANAQKANSFDAAQAITQYNSDVADLSRVYIFKNSPEYYDRFKKYYNDKLSGLNAVNFDNLTVSDKVDFLLLKRNISKALLDLSTSENIYRQVSEQVSFAESIIDLQRKRRRGDYLDGEATANILVSVKQKILKTNQNLNQQSFSKEQVEKLTDIVHELRAGLQNTFDFYNGYDPQFTWWTKKSFTEVDSLLQGFAKNVKAHAAKESLVKDDGSGIIGNPIGSKALKDLLAYEMIPYSAEELVDIANKEFAWCDAEMLKASQAMGFGNDWKKALEKVKEN